MSRVWKTHTVVAKSPQTLPNVGIQRIEFYPGMFLDASLSSRSSLTRALASLPLHDAPHRQCEVHICTIQMTILLPKTIAHEELSSSHEMCSSMCTKIV